MFHDVGLRRNGVPQTEHLGLARSEVGTDHTLIERSTRLAHVDPSWKSELAMRRLGGDSWRDDDPAEESG